MEKEERRFENIILKIYPYVIVAVVLTVFLIRQFCGAVVSISGRSMEPTFYAGDHVLCKRVYNCSDIKKGDVVLFPHDGLLVIKRVAGLPGDTINGTEVQEGEIYVLGDNAEKSLDSRSFGTIHEKDIRYLYQKTISTPLAITGKCTLIVILTAFAAVCEYKSRKKRTK